MRGLEETIMTEGNGTPTPGWLALLGGGEFSFGETEDADQAWLDKVPPGPIGRTLPNCPTNEPTSVR